MGLCMLGFLIPEGIVTRLTCCAGLSFGAGFSEGSFTRQASRVIRLQAVVPQDCDKVGARGLGTAALLIVYLFRLCR